MTIYYNKSEYGEGVQVVGSRREAIDFAVALRTDGTVLTGQGGTPAPDSVILKTVSFHVKPTGKCMVAVKGDEVIISGGKSIIEGCSEVMEIFARNAPVGHEHNWDTAAGSPSAEPGSAEFLFSLTSE